MVEMIQMIQISRGLPAMAAEESIEKAAIWELALGDIPTDQLGAVVEKALRDYTDIKEPFGTPQLRSAWRSIERSREQEARELKEREREALREQERVAAAENATSGTSQSAEVHFFDFLAGAGKDWPDETKRMVALIARRPLPRGVLQSERMTRVVEVLEEEPVEQSGAADNRSRT